MIEYNQLLTNILILLEILFAFIAVFSLWYTSKSIQGLEKKIKQSTKEVVCNTIEVRQEIRTLNKYLNFMQTFKKYSVIKSVAANAIDIINLLLLLAPGTSLLKIRKFLSLQVLKGVFSMMKV